MNIKNYLFQILAIAIAYFYGINYNNLSIMAVILLFQILFDYMTEEKSPQGEVQVKDEGEDEVKVKGEDEVQVKELQGEDDKIVDLYNFETEKSIETEPPAQINYMERFMDDKLILSQSQSGGNTNIVSSGEKINIGTSNGFLSLYDKKIGLSTNNDFKISFKFSNNKVEPIKYGQSVLMDFDGHIVNHVDYLNINKNNRDVLFVIVKKDEVVPRGGYLNVKDKVLIRTNKGYLKFNEQKNLIETDASHEKASVFTINSFKK